MRASVGMAPILPGISDRPEQLEAVVRAAREAGACGVWANVLYLRPGTREHFLEHLARDWPEELERYERLYAKGAYLKGQEAKAIRATVAELKERYAVRDRAARGSSRRASRSSSSSRSRGGSRAPARGDARRRRRRTSPTNASTARLGTDSSRTRAAAHRERRVHPRAGRRAPLRRASGRPRSRRSIDPIRASRSGAPPAASLSPKKTSPEMTEVAERPPARR